MSLDDLARHVRAGEHLLVTDKKSGADVTAQTLALVVYEQARQGEQLVTSELLHDVIRSGLGQVQDRVEAIVNAGVDRVKPLLRAREELERLREGMAGIERSLKEFAKSGNSGSRRSALGARPRRKNKRK